MNFRYINKERILVLILGITLLTVNAFSESYVMPGVVLPYDYTFYISDSTYYAKNCYGLVEYSGSDPDTVITNAFNENPDSVFFKAGSYDVDTTLYPKTGISIFAEPETIINWVGSTTTSVMKVNNQDDVRIEGLHFHTNVDYVTALELDDCNNIYVIGNEFIGFERHAIFIYGYSEDVSNIYIEKNIFDNEGLGTVELSGWDCNALITMVPKNANRIHDVFIRGNVFQRTLNQDGTDIRSQNRLSGSAVYNIYIQNNIFRDIKVCWQWHAVINTYYAGLKNYYVENNILNLTVTPTYNQSMIVLSSEDSSTVDNEEYITRNAFIRGNYIDAGHNALWSGILVHGYPVQYSQPPYNLRQIVVTDNIVRNIESGSGISFGYCNDYTIANNVVNSVKSNGIKISGSFSATCTGNIVDSVDTQGIYVLNHQYGTITGNIVRDTINDTFTPDYGILEATTIAPPSGYISNYNIYVNNMCFNASTSNITINTDNAGSAYTKVNLCYNGTTWVDTWP